MPDHEDVEGRRIGSALTPDQEKVIVQKMPNTVKTLTFDEAARIIAGSHEASRKLDEACTVAVLDNAGHLIASGRMDGAAALSIECAEKKARTAQTFRRSVADLMDDIRHEPEIGLGLQMAREVKVMLLPGALPVMHEGACIGAVGVSGGTQDTNVAQAGIDALGLN